MELRHLRYFLMVAEEQHFTRAAMRLNMQQPPLSNQIRILERELGFELFRRHPKGVDLTAGGQVFLQEARAILSRVEDGSKRAARAAKGLEGALSIAFTSSAAAHPLIPRMIRSYRELYPSVTLLLSEGNAGELTEEVQSRRVSIGILRAPVAHPQGITLHRLLNEEMLLVLPVGHRLLPVTIPVEPELPSVSLKALADESFILVRRRGAPGMYSKLIEACESAGFTPKIAFEIERMLTNINLVAAGAGVSVVPASMLGFHRDSVVYCRIQGARPRLVAPITLLCGTDDLEPTTQNFIALAKELGRKHRKESS
ncbi:MULTISPECIES: LysR family transcriptional regulator [unclassified Pseudomonas]|uniref:LysR family transcriptional regulator n=1 Tax=unclassified Pseudomonas TaxID=196821 RepID=UPI002ACB1564|nr:MULTISPECIES: LysR family transcriptional regulator [unclassified Pseudomonas]MEB0043618.1 LysR family transcriptional regulator [Pseudomonas sp. MH10]MEB0091832.1 LysR family transcriptional regulator [Pseudomonas sp. CCI4.2]MEB0119249.1 LysR family transcriptional regulator [Pseudomonas sp. CCI1.2]WPX54818.1 LysR family transcriptional regulator [Pseudomonas sp. CCI4.2]WPX62277.1 LysR family transcriptional regulator [Pseudomonas sp. MH10]